MKIEYSKVRTAMEYLLIVALYYVTGGAFSYTNYSTQITVFFLIALCICVFTGGYHYVLRKKVFTALFAMSFFVILVPLLFNDSIPTYIAIIMQLGIGAFCASVISPENFKQKYINVIVFFAAVSLVGFAIGLIIPSFALNFPVTIGDASVDYYNAGIYVFMKAKGYGSLVLMKRNAGICWEPGCYQAFLNIALLFLLDEQQKKLQRHFYLKSAILLITIVTTVSTNGFLLMGLIMALYHSTWINRTEKKWVSIPLVIVLLVVTYSYAPIREQLQIKIGREFGVNNGFLERISLSRIGYLVSDTGIPYVLGMSFSKWLTYDVSLWNSVIHSFLCLGIPFTVIQLNGYWKGGNRLVSKRGILFLVMILCASTETLFWRVFFNTIAFYGWIGYRRELQGGKGNICES